MVLVDLSIQLDDDCHLIVMQRGKNATGGYKKVYDGLNDNFGIDFTDLYFDKVLLIKSQGDAIKVFTQERSLLEAILDDDD